MPTIDDQHIEFATKVIADKPDTLYTNNVFRWLWWRWNLFFLHTLRLRPSPEIYHKKYIQPLVDYAIAEGIPKRDIAQMMLESAIEANCVDKWSAPLFKQKIRDYLKQ